MKRNDLEVYDQDDAWWDPAEPVFGPLKRLVPARLALLREQGSWAGRAVLDVGCGGGYMSEAVAALGARVTGIDRAQRALHAARAHAGQAGLDIAYQQASADALPFEDGSFDAALCTDVLVHVPDHRAVLAELARVLRPGGSLLVSSIDRTWLSRLVLVTLGEDLLRMVHRGTHDPAKFIRPAELRADCAAVGLELGPVRGLGPVGWSRGGFTFGRHPTTWVMYQGLATRAG